MNLRKGFYFSFDAFMALSVMAAALVVVGQSSQISADPFKVSTINYQRANSVGQDAMKMASIEKFNTFNSSFQNDLVSNTVMKDSDINRTIMDGISLLWAARNFTYARRSAKNYFDTKIPDKYDYKLQVTEGGTKTVIYQTSPMPANPEFVSSISRLVSGHKIDKPSEGFQARARAKKVTKNSTKVVSIPPLGMAPHNSKMEMKKTFWLNNTENIINGTFYISVHYSGASHFEQFKINGDQYGESKFDWLYDRDTSTGAAAYGKLNVSGDLQKGKNTLYLRLKGGNYYNSHFHPGTKLVIHYSSSQGFVSESELVHKHIRYEDIHSESPSGESGIFSVKQFSVPFDSQFINATYHLRAKNLDPECGYWTFFGRQPGWDVQVKLNGNQVSADCASGYYSKDLPLDYSDVQNGTNVLTTFIESQGDTRWGGRDTHLLSEDNIMNQSYIDLWYRRDKGSLRFGQIRVTSSQNIGGSASEPKYFDKKFRYKDLDSTHLYIAQLFSTNPSISVDDGTNTRTVFSSSAPRSAPTGVYIGPDYYDLNNTNTIGMKDYDGSPERSYLPESTFQWTVWVPSQVGYGQLFENQSAALDDAKQRLKDVLGPFVDATGINTGTISTGNQPYLWGPASVKLVIWRE